MDDLALERVGPRWLIEEMVETWTGRGPDSEETLAS